jgi:hypothetical protein
LGAACLLDESQRDLPRDRARARVSADEADAASAIIGVALILSVTGTFFRARPGWRRHADPVWLALVWAGLTIAFEFTFGHYVDRKSWGELAGNYAIWHGKWWPLVLLSLVAAPFL